MKLQSEVEMAQEKKMLRCVLASPFAKAVTARAAPSHLTSRITSFNLMKQSSLSAFFGKSAAASAAAAKAEPAAAAAASDSAAKGKKRKRSSDQTEVKQEEEIIFDEEENLETKSEAKTSPKVKREKKAAAAASPTAKPRASKRSRVIADDEDEDVKMEEAEDKSMSEAEQSQEEFEALKDQEASSSGAASAANDDDKRFEQMVMVKAKVAGGSSKQSYAYEDFDPTAELDYWKKSTAAAASTSTQQQGTSAPYMHLAKTLNSIADTSSRIKITELLTNCFRVLLERCPEDLLPAIYLSVNKLAPDYAGIELGVGESILIKAIAEATGKQVSRIKEQLAKEGDLGSVAAVSRATQKTMFQPKPLTIQQVFKEFKFIATTSGTKSQAKKQEKIQLLLVSARDCETQFIVRSLEGKLRIGLGEETVLVALAHAVLIHHNNKRLAASGSGSNKKRKGQQIPSAVELKQAEEALKAVYSEMPQYDSIVDALLNNCQNTENPFLELHKHCHLTAGVPVHPMLAKPSKGFQEVLERFSNVRFTCEYKYDGERAQVHMDTSGKISIYSRNLEDNTGKFPDIARDLPKALNHTEEQKITSFIIDCEVVAYDKEAKTLRPFQILATRGRKNIKLEDIKVPICIFAFDLLYLNGKSYLRETLEERRKALRSAFKQVDDEFFFASSVDTDDLETIQGFMNEAVANSCEGLMIKSLEKEGSTYEPSKRSFNWLKLKKDYLKGLGDSVDLVPIGGYLGKGKRTGVYGGFLLACYDPDNEEFQTVCKIGTGFSDEVLTKLSNEMNEHRIPKPKGYYRWGSGVEPDIWFDAAQVWEIAAADLTISPVHKAASGLVDENKGIALRFPRLVRQRDDKKPEEATSSYQIAELYNKQFEKRDIRDVLRLNGEAAAAADEEAEEDYPSDTEKSPASKSRAKGKSYEDDEKLE